MHSKFIVEMDVTANNIKILCAAQQCFYGQYTSPTPIKLFRSSQKGTDIFVRL